jgi:hypothetical protein
MMSKSTLLSPESLICSEKRSFSQESPSGFVADSRRWENDKRDKANAKVGQLARGKSRWLPSNSNLGILFSATEARSRNSTRSTRVNQPAIQLTGHETRSKTLSDHRSDRFHLLVQVVLHFSTPGAVIVWKQRA